MTSVAVGTRVGFLLCFFEPPLKFLALVTRAGKTLEDGPRLKTAAAMAESGELKEMVEETWTSDGSGSDERPQKVGCSAIYLDQLTAIRKSIYSSPRPMKHHWNPSTSFLTTDL